MKKTRFIAAVCLLSLLCAVLSGCGKPIDSSGGQPEPSTESQLRVIPGGHSVNPELKRLNHDLDYAAYDYTYPNELYSDDFHNLTGTQSSIPEDADFAIGWRILSGMEDLEAFEQTVDDFETACLEERQRYRSDAEKTDILAAPRRTAAVEYDEAFFQTNRLLLIDLCARSTFDAYFYPENLEVNGDTVRLDIRWDSSSAIAGTSAGQFCLIVIPTGCTNAELNLIHDPGE